jgi:hypothetical protein
MADTATLTVDTATPTAPPTAPTKTPITKGVTGPIRQDQATITTTDRDEATMIIKVAAVEPEGLVSLALPVYAAAAACWMDAACDICLKLMVLGINLEPKDVCYTLPSHILNRHILY